MKLLVPLLIVLIPIAVALECYFCNQGYETQLYCSNLLPKDMKVECTEPDAQCLEAIEWFQGGALRMVRRQCWPPNNSTVANFCDDYDNPVGQLQQCRTCNDSMCNGNVIYQPNQFLSCI